MRGGGGGSGDPALDASKGLLFVGDTSRFLLPKGAECPVVLLEVAGLEANEPGGRGSS